MGSSAPIFQHMWKLDNLVMTVPLLIISKNYFLFIFDHFLLIMLLLIFKSLLRVVAWKCQIVKMWSFLQEQGAVKILFFFIFFNQMIILTNDIMICNILPNMCLILFFHFTWACPCSWNEGKSTKKLKMLKLQFNIISKTVLYNYTKSRWEYKYLLKHILSKNLTLIRHFLKSLLN